MDHPTAAALLEVPLFADLPADHLERLAETFETDEHPAGHAIVREGEAGYAFFVIASGTVSVTHDGRELRTMGPGEFFGEISIAGEGRRTATVTATSPVEVWVLFGADFRVLEVEHPEIAAALSKAIELRLATG